MSDLKDNKWVCRKDVVKGLLDLIRPLKPFYNQEKSCLKIGNTMAHYGERSAQMEGFARVLWGLGPVFCADNSDLEPGMKKELKEWEEHYVTGLINGTDPESAGYWGEMKDFDQMMVESAALSVALCLSRDALWEPLSPREKENLEAWLRQINDHKVHGNNWRFFRILVNMTFARLGLEIDAGALVDDFTVIENCYVSEGWYYDGHPGQMDYYIPFAMHFYGLIWAALAPEVDAETAGEAAECFSAGYKEKLLERGRLFAEQYSLWFADDGAEVPFGRSLTYRFAHGAFWSALLFAEDKVGGACDFGRYRHILLSNLRDWFQYPITDAAGFLTIGYRYPNLFMSERYNAPGSPYWSFKAFLILAVGANSPVWTAPEERVTAPEKSYLKAPHMIICHDNSGSLEHVTMFPCGQYPGMDHGNCESKYKKLVYSNRFGFSVQRGNGPDDGAFDNVFSVSRKGENIFRMTNCIKWEADENRIHITSEPMEGVKVETFVIPGENGWHVREHHIDTQISIDVLDGGFALPAIGEIVNSREDGAALRRSDFGYIGARTEDPDCEISFVRASPNTNLMYPLTDICYVKRSYEPGKYFLRNAFYGKV